MVKPDKTDNDRIAHYIDRRTLGNSRSNPGILRHTGRHIVLLREGLGRGAVHTLQNVAGLRMGVSADSASILSHEPLLPGEGMLFHHLGAALVHADPDQVAALGRQTAGNVASIERERFVNAINATGQGVSVNDARETWGLQSTGVATSRFSGRGIRIAILDTGIDLKHPDFVGRLIVSHSFVAGEAVDDGNGHGTYCAGLACGPTSPSQPPRYGVASDAELYVGKVISDNGTGTDGSILAGIDWAARCGCVIVSLSVGTPVAQGEPYSQIYEQVAQRALTAGTLIMSAAGNDSLRPDNIAPVDHPANCPSIFAVAAVDQYMRVASFSCGGINGDGGEVDIAAPGVAIRSSWLRPDLYRTDSGTSMAVPLAAGIAALLAEAYPTQRGRDLLTVLTQGAQPMPFPARDVGAGMIRAP